MTNMHTLATAIRESLNPESATLSEEQKANYMSHSFGPVDDYYGCVMCDIGVWNAHKRSC